jgi:hypothetical protein
VVLIVKKNNLLTLCSVHAKGNLQVHDAAREQGCAAVLLACNCQIMWADVIKDSFKFEFLKSFISQTVDPIDNPFLPLAYSR